MELGDPARPEASCFRNAVGTVESRRSRAYNPFRTYSVVTRSEGANVKAQPSFLSVDCKGAPQDVFLPTIRIRDLGAGSGEGINPRKFRFVLAPCSLVSRLDETRGIVDM